ncbi:hypothetical protein HDU90_002197 [Geranomyces variabilis]|nr:hypothetical protein HDU90_002197 [Geranomyces variabilis]
MLTLQNGDKVGIRAPPGAVVVHHPAVPTTAETPARSRFSILGAYLDLRHLNNEQVVREGSGHDQIDFQHAIDDLRRAAPDKPAPAALQVLNTLLLDAPPPASRSVQRAMHVGRSGDAAGAFDAKTGKLTLKMRETLRLKRDKLSFESVTELLVLPAFAAQVGKRNRHWEPASAWRSHTADQNEEDEEEDEKQVVVALIKAIVSDVWASCRVQTERRHFFLDGAYTKSDIVVTTPASAAALSQPMPYLVAGMARGGDAIHKDFVVARSGRGEPQRDCRAATGVGRTSKPMSYSWEIPGIPCPAGAYPGRRSSLDIGEGTEL